MALEAGVLTLTLQYGKDLKDQDWFGKQDPYAVIAVGGQTFRTRTAVDGGRNPVWNVRRTSIDIHTTLVLRSYLRCPA